MFYSHSDLEAVLATFHDSFDRCKANPDFFEVFYNRFLSASEEIRVLFVSTDMDRLKRKLRDSFYLVMMASSGSGIARERFEKLGVFHKSKGATPEQFNLWLSALIEAVAQTDPAFSPEVEQSWKIIMAVGVEIMKAEVEKAS